MPFVGPEKYSSSSGFNVYNFGYIFGTTNYIGSTKVDTLYKYGSNGDYSQRATYYLPSNLTEVTIIGTTFIQDYAFYNYSQLTKIILSSNVTTIGTKAFYGCSGLTSITIPSSVTKIGSYAFYGCNSNLSIYYKGSQSNWNSITISSGNDLLSTVNIVYNS